MDVHGFNIVFRPEWNASPCKGFESPGVPLEYVVLYYNTETPKCNNKKECCNLLDDLQAYQQKACLADIHYNYLIGGDGNVYEGRGDVRFPSKCVHNHDYDSKSYAIAYIGDWSKDTTIPEEMTNAFSLLMNLMVKRKCLVENYTLITEKRPLPIVWTTKPRKMKERIISWRRTPQSLN